MYIVFKCRRVIFEWEGLGLKSFQNDTSLSLIFSINIVNISHIINMDHDYG